MGGNSARRNYVRVEKNLLTDQIQRDDFEWETIQRENFEWETFQRDLTVIP